MASHNSSQDGASEEHKPGFIASPFEVQVTQVNVSRKNEARTTWETDSLDSYYKPIDSYEGAHRYDPDFEWTPAEEKKIVRKVSKTPGSNPKSF